MEMDSVQLFRLQKEYIKDELKKYKFKECKAIYNKLESTFFKINSEVTDDSSGIVALTTLLNDLHIHDPLVLTFINNIYYQIANIEIVSQNGNALADTIHPAQRGCVLCSILIAMLMVLQRKSENAAVFADEYLNRAREYYRIGQISCWEILNRLFLYLADEIVTIIDNNVIIEINKKNEQLRAERTEKQKRLTTRIEQRIREDSINSRALKSYPTTEIKRPTRTNPSRYPNNTHTTTRATTTTTSNSKANLLLPEIPEIARNRLPPLPPSYLPTTLPTLPTTLTTTKTRVPLPQFPQRTPESSDWLREVQHAASVPLQIKQRKQGGGRIYSLKTKARTLKSKNKKSKNEKSKNKKSKNEKSKIRA